MKFHKIQCNEPKVGTKRTIERFAFLPTVVEEPQKTVIWLESYFEVQEYKEVVESDHGLPIESNEWVPVINTVKKSNGF